MLAGDKGRIQTSWHTEGEMSQKAHVLRATQKAGIVARQPTPGSSRGPQVQGEGSEARSTLAVKTWISRQFCQLLVGGPGLPGCFQFRSRIPSKDTAQQLRANFIHFFGALFFFLTFCVKWKAEAPVSSDFTSKLATIPSLASFTLVKNQTRPTLQSTRPGQEVRARLG